MSSHRDPGPGDELPRARRELGDPRSAPCAGVDGSGGIYDDAVGIGPYWKPLPHALRGEVHNGERVGEVLRDIELRAVARACEPGGIVPAAGRVGRRPERDA